MDKQARLNTIRLAIKEHEESKRKLDNWIENLVKYSSLDYQSLRQRSYEGIAIEGLIEDLKIEAKSLQEDIELDARIDNL